ncbi:hypothetical protein CKAH01_12160 [Colletotrichum kahawae]|uniref:Uncharacterized protein n=1 Tax=Colletotrichum kahawae TaxID=34407 RepID=A0AAE0DBH1_COLKA|nr:hypothetical protein CKAH01_12160 [Colletotrichum kahawae]
MVIDFTNDGVSNTVTNVKNVVEWCKQDINSHMGSGCDKLEVIPGFSDLYGNAWGSPKTQDVFTGRVVMIYKGR